MSRQKGQPFSAYTEPSFKFWYDEKWYSVQGAETMVSIGTKDDMATMRSEYTRMRDAAQKRVSRLQKSFPESVGAQRKYNTGKVDKDGNPIYKPGFPTLKTLRPEDFAKAFSDLAKFLKAKHSTVTGQRSMQEKTIDTLNKAIGADSGEGDEDGTGQARVTPQNYWRVLKLLEESRRRKVIYGSDKLVTIAETTLEMDDSQFNSVLDNLDKFVNNADELEESLEDYMARKNIKGFQRVNMDDFIKQTGW